MGHTTCTAWLQQSYNQSAAIQTQSAMLCHGATQNSSPITNTIPSDCSSCVLVSFQKVPVLAGCVGAWFLFCDSERDLMYLDKVEHMYIVPYCEALAYFFYLFIFLKNFSLLSPPDVSVFPLFFFFLLVSSLCALAAQVFLKANNKSCKRDHNWKRERQSGAAISSYLFILSFHTNTQGRFKPVNIQTLTPDVLCLPLFPTVKY